ncbi:MAG: FMN-binding domain protein [Oscillospiraceae bacterium]|nr:FMN-binding domain protein [Oscillospiraceae bacterium]
MLFVIALIFACIFIYFFKNPLKKYPFLFFVPAIVAVVFTSMFDFKGAPEFLNDYVIELFRSGVLGTAFWCMVMWTGALPNGSKLIKALMPIRAELSILAAILTLSHAIYYGKTYILKLFSLPKTINAVFLWSCIVVIILLAIMLPLTVISFPKIRKKMNPKLWKNIQKAAYIFYALIYVHIMIIFVPMARAGREGYLFSIIAYSLVFIGYAVFRIRKWYILKKKPAGKKLLNAVCSGAFAFGMIFTVMLSAPANKINSNAIAENVKKENVQSQIAQETSAEILISDEKAETSIPEEKREKQTESVIEESTEISAEISAETEQSEAKTTSAETTANESSQTSLSQTENAKYKDGMYSASAYGYDGEISVTVTIKNGVIAMITGETKESDPWYYEQARDYVIPQILNIQNCDVDAVSGATYSSKAIMDAVEKALESAKN